MTTIDFQSPICVACAGATLKFEPGGRVELASPGAPPLSATATGLELSNFVELWCGDDRAYFIGLKSKALWYVRPSRGQFTRVMEVDRLDLAGGYDPGGLHLVKFIGLPGGDLLVVHELGAARVSPEGSAKWQQGHDQLSAHYDAVDDNAVWFQGEYERFGFDLGDGHPVLAPQAS